MIWVSLFVLLLLIGRYLVDRNETLEMRPFLRTCVLLNLLVINQIIFLLVILNCICFRSKRCIISLYCFDLIRTLVIRNLDYFQEQLLWRKFDLFILFLGEYILLGLLYVFNLKDRIIFWDLYQINSKLKCLNTFLLDQNFKLDHFQRCLYDL